MTYEITRRERYGRTETITDLKSFAADLAAELGGTVYVNPNRPDYPDENQSIDIENPEAGTVDRLLLRANHYGAKGKVAVSISPTRIEWDDRPMYDQRAVTASANVSPSRGVAAVARDIRKRVIEASAAALAFTRQYVADRQDGRTQVAAHAERLRAQFPAIRIEPSDKEPSARVHFYLKSGVYADGTLYPNGQISFARVSVDSARQSVAILAALADQEPAS